MITSVNSRSRCEDYTIYEILILFSTCCRKYTFILSCIIHSSHHPSLMCFPLQQAVVSPLPLVLLWSKRRQIRKPHNPAQEVSS